MRLKRFRHSKPYTLNSSNVFPYLTACVYVRVHMCVCVDMVVVVGGIVRNWIMLCVGIPGGCYCGRLGGITSFKRNTDDLCLRWMKYVSISISVTQRRITHVIYTFLGNTTAACYSKVFLCVNKCCIQNWGWSIF